MAKYRDGSFMRWIHLLDYTIQYCTLGPYIRGFCGMVFFDRIRSCFVSTYEQKLIFVYEPLRADMHTCCILSYAVFCMLVLYKCDAKFYFLSSCELIATSEVIHALHILHLERSTLSPKVERINSSNLIRGQRKFDLRPSQ